MCNVRLSGLIISFFIQLSLVSSISADSISNNPIAFITTVPNPTDFGTMAATFGNHIANPDTAFRGGDLWIRYPDGSLKNITESAGYGTSGFQGANAIAVRDPSVHWDGQKIIFSMVIGAALQQYQVNSYRWQLYEVTGIGQNETAQITKVANQPANYNNLAPIYASDDSIIFISDRPRDDSVLHTYPQRDEYESSPVNSGLWKIEHSNGSLRILDHSPSGNFNPIIDSYGRLIFTRWDHLQRDQQNVGVDFDAFNFKSEGSSEKLSSATEVFPEPRSNVDPDRKANVNLYTINHFLPWMMNQDGTDMETLNHIGRQEIGVYSERSFNDDPNVQEFYGQYSTGLNENEFNIFLHIKENPNVAGNYFGINCQEFATHSAGQIISINGQQALNPNQMKVTYQTHADTAGASNTPSINHSGLYRDPLPLSDGKLIAAHTANTREDSNIGTSSSPLSRYDFRLKLLNKGATYYSAGSTLTAGISKTVSFWSPDRMISFSGNLWEIMPVEIKSRNRPAASSLQIPDIEKNLIQSMGVSLNELTEYLRSQNLALIISRNLTSRDKNDRQQPVNLKVAGSNTKSLPYQGKIYEISDLEIFQGDLIRAYDRSSMTGRRVLAQKMHSVSDGLNLNLTSKSRIQIADDGSMAAFVPASRALSWQLNSPDGSAVVRERFWVTFQPGEVRVCASCHGINSTDHLGNSAPVNPPQALAKLIANWKELPPPEFTAVPDQPSEPPSNPPQLPGPALPYSLKFQGNKHIANAKFSALIKAASGENLRINVRINKKTCTQNFDLLATATDTTIKGKLPDLAGSKISLDLSRQSIVVGTDQTVLRANKKKSSKKHRKLSLKNACQKLFASLK